MTSPEPARLSDALGRIESELRAIWAPDETGFAKPRATTLNLIAVHGQKDGAEFVASVDEVAARLFARTFVLSVDPRLEPWSLEGDVSAVCRLEPGSGREALCADRLDLRFGAIAAKRAGSVLEALMESSLPTALLVGPGAHGSIVDSLCPTSSSVVIDSREVGVHRACEIARATSARLEDLAFLRIRRWREMTARFFDDPEVRPALDGVTSLALTHAPRPDHAGARAEAELLVAWMGSRLGWRVERGELRAAKGAAIAVEIQDTPAPGASPGCMMSLDINATIAAGRITCRARRSEDGEHIDWEIDAPCAHPAPRRFSTPRRGRSELVERAIRNPNDDQLVRQALSFAQKWKANA